MRKLYRVIMFIPNKIISMVSLALNFIGKVSKLLMVTFGYIFALGALVLFILDKTVNLIGLILLILAVACFFGQRLAALLQQGIFTLKNWYSSRM